MAVFLNLRDVLLCVKVLIAITTGSSVPPWSPEAADGYCSYVSISGVREVSEKDMDSLLRRIEEYSQRYFITPSKSAKLARHLLGKLKAEISNDGHPPHLIEYDDVRPIYDEPLGEGGSGAVYQCDFLGRRAAAKVLIRKITNRKAVENEINLLSRVRHPNVVYFIGYTYKETRNVIVTELMSKDLRTYIDEKKEASGERQPPLSLLLAINIMQQIADGMNHLHESGVMHRDLKSNNVLVNVVDDQDGSPLSSSLVQVKLTDFGVSKLNLHDSGCSTRMVGTTKWRAPEVFEDEENREKYTNSADVYSFAIIFSEVLTGEMPFQGMPQTNLLQRIRNGERPPLPHVDYCPDYLSELINKCWATNPHERPLFREICQMLVDCKQRILMQPYLVSSRSSQWSILEEKGLGCLEVDSDNDRTDHEISLGGSANNWTGGWDGNPSSSSGGGICENMKFGYGYGMLRGRSASMEDFLDTQIPTINGQAIGLFGVFDGHNGFRTAEYVKHHLFDNLLRHPKLAYDIKLAIAETFQQTDQDYLHSEINCMDATSTACTCLVVGDHLLVANIGDSRAVICRGGEAVGLSIDQTPNRTDERQQIEDAGGVVVEGFSRVSCAFGAGSLKQYVVADPEIQEYDIEEGVDFLILATAGLWNVLSNQEAVSMVESLVDPEEAAMLLTGEAYRRGSADNITCVIIRFSHIH
jgi:protein phosphatase 1L